MKKVIATCAYVPLFSKKLSQDQFHDFAARLEKACQGKLHFFDQFPFSECWLVKENPEVLNLPVATGPEDFPHDRYDTPEQMLKVNIVQHSRTQWALMALEECPDADVVVWLDTAILKQGYWNGNPVLEEQVTEFLDNVGRYTGHDIPFPGINGPLPINPHGNNWRFVGSTHIWPVKWLHAIDEAYRFETLKFIRKHGCVPLDLAIWPAVESEYRLPFEWYKAEYDATQLTNFPCIQKEVQPCLLPGPQ